MLERKSKQHRQTIKMKKVFEKAKTRNYYGNEPGQKRKKRKNDERIENHDEGSSEKGSPSNRIRRCSSGSSERPDKRQWSLPRRKDKVIKSPPGIPVPDVYMNEIVFFSGIHFVSLPTAGLFSRSRPRGTQGPPPVHHSASVGSRRDPWRVLWALKVAKCSK